MCGAGFHTRHFELFLRSISMDCACEGDLCGLLSLRLKIFWSDLSLSFLHYSILSIFEVDTVPIVSIPGAKSPWLCFSQLDFPATIRGGASITAETVAIAS